MEKTEWFPGTERPVHVGVYETWSDGPESWFQFWNGAYWGWSEHSPLEAYNRKEIYSRHQHDQWRGLTEPHHGTE